jgi:O-6-methylguanine DNA methyltransferase
MQESNDFFRRVYDVVRRIPHGKVTTYGHIAAYLGARSSARMVGFAMNAVTHDGRVADVPAHRVVNRFGALTGRMHFETPYLMRERLEAEGVTFVSAEDSPNGRPLLLVGNEVSQTMAVFEVEQIRTRSTK